MLDAARATCVAADGRSVEMVAAFRLPVNPQSVVDAYAAPATREVISAAFRAALTRSPSTVAADGVIVRGVTAARRLQEKSDSSPSVLGLKSLMRALFSRMRIQDNRKLDYNLRFRISC